MAMTISSYQKNCRRGSCACRKGKREPPFLFDCCQRCSRKGGTSSLKDMAVLQRLFQTEESLQNHASDVLRLAKEGGYDGVEIDYEGLWKRGDSLLQSQYVHFLHVLVRMAEKRPYPSASFWNRPFPSMRDFPEGPRMLSCSIICMARTAVQDQRPMTPLSKEHAANGSSPGSCRRCAGNGRRRMA